MVVCFQDPGCVAAFSGKLNVVWSIVSSPYVDRASPFSPCCKALARQAHEEIMASAKALKTQAQELWKRNDKINAELFTLTYGAMVVQIIKDYEDYDEVNKQLEKMGYNMGTRMIEDFLARTGMGRCADFRETGEVLAKVAFKSFLNIVPTIVHYPPSLPPPNLIPYSSSSSSTQQPATPQPTFMLTLEENPLAEFVELPEDAVEKGLWYSNVICGVIRGALEMVQLSVHVRFISDVLRGDESTVIEVRLQRHLEEEVPVGDD